MGSQSVGKIGRAVLKEGCETNLGNNQQQEVRIYKATTVCVMHGAQEILVPLLP
jgi:hypothetical protein